MDVTAAHDVAAPSCSSSPKYSRDESPKTASSFRLLAPPAKASKTPCKLYPQGYCWRGPECWFLHESAGSQPSTSTLPSREAPAATVTSAETATLPIEDEDQCGICLEVPKMFGLLELCSHVFCLTCIKEWRTTKNKASQQIESGWNCPTCRRHCPIITPSSVFIPDGEKKKAVIATYKAAMARIPCKYFMASDEDSPACPFGLDCFYRHSRTKGAPQHVFTHDYAETQRRRRRRREGREAMGDRDRIESLVYYSLGFTGFIDDFDEGEEDEEDDDEDDYDDQWETDNDGDLN